MPERLRRLAAYTLLALQAARLAATAIASLLALYLWLRLRLLRSRIAFRLALYRHRVPRPLRRKLNKEYKRELMRIASMMSLTRLFKIVEMTRTGLHQAKHTK
ncbi:hypothetical protein [Pyrodictium abyssi]|uniref:Uncharacterized protein n=1 Tax=Pyrodictium abyssi TaxID=54256 RepID=A0ABN6ZLQ4_9CREN|nr:hypothetical protein PABY_07340 [Pyrodictium abyssi]